MLIVGQDDVKLHGLGIGIGHREQRDDALLAFDGGEDRLLELVQRQFRNLGAVDGAAVADRRQRVDQRRCPGGTHGRTSRKCAASRSMTFRNAGMCTPSSSTMPSDRRIGNPVNNPSR